MGYFGDRVNCTKLLFTRKYIEENNSTSDKDTVNVEGKTMITNGMEQCKSHELMPSLMKRMFNYELEIENVERDMCSMPEKMPLDFNYMHLFFQIFPNNSEDSYKKLQNDERLMQIL